MSEICTICPHFCNLDEGHTGFCNARTNVDGKIVCSNYGRLTSIALDSIEKKPLRKFFPGSMILSVGSYGCNLKCPFCQNCSISMATVEDSESFFVSPNDLVQKAMELVDTGNIGIAYTYNEPTISFEYIYDCAKLAHKESLKNVLVTNGYINEEPLLKILPVIDAMNIDLKGFTNYFYKKICGDLETVKNTITIVAKSCHVEVTTLIIPGENDSESEMNELSSWLASVDETIPLHISRFFPQYKYSDKQPTPIETIYKLAEIAQMSLKYVYTGNL